MHILSHAISYSFRGNWSPWALIHNSHFDTQKILFPVIQCTFFWFKKMISEVGHHFHVPLAWVKKFSWDTNTQSLEAKCWELLNYCTIKIDEMVNSTWAIKTLISCFLLKNKRSPESISAFLFTQFPLAIQKQIWLVWYNKLRWRWTKRPTLTWQSWNTQPWIMQWT